MNIKLLKGKLHGVKATGADLDYEGSVVIDQSLMEMAGIVPFEEVHIWNRSNGHRLTTYAIEGKPGSGEIIVNGAAAHRVSEGDTLIIAAYAYLHPDEVKAHKPKVILIKNHNEGFVKP
ncbi:MAG: aspartate 1-decarboxylase [Bdellovibrionales bacterium]|nr:aspartate 1-decarboxylase [Bdellovibrionales bacterium]